MALPTSQREVKTPHREQTFASPVPFVSQSNDKTFTCVIQLLSRSNENVPRLVGFLATAQKPCTVAEVYTRSGSISRLWKPLSLHLLSIGLGNVIVTVNRPRDRSVLIQPDHLAPP